MLDLNSRILFVLTAQFAEIFSEDETKVQLLRKLEGKKSRKRLLLRANEKDRRVMKNLSCPYAESVSLLNNAITNSIAIRETLFISQ